MKRARSFNRVTRWATAALVPGACLGVGNVFGQAEPDRTVLPIQFPEAPPVTEVDAAKVPVPIVVEPSLKVTVPVGEEPPVSVAVKVTVEVGSGVVVDAETEMVGEALPTVTETAEEVAVLLVAAFAISQE